MEARVEKTYTLAELMPRGSHVPALVVGGLCDTSSAVRRGDAFVALAGSRRHGVEFALEAQHRGAAVIVYDPEGAHLPAGLTVPAIAVPRLKDRLGEIAARYHGDPSVGMEVIGITGTNGKTSCSLFLAQVLPGAVVGTLGWGCPPDLQPTGHTTAPALETHRRLAVLRAQGVRTVAMEVSSHALDQGRVNGVAFDFAVWTNLSRDHLDYHPSLEAYAAVKTRLMGWPGLQAVVLNLDDPAWPVFWRAVAPGVRVYGYTAAGGRRVPFPCLAATQVAHHRDGMDFSVAWGGERLSVRVPLLGQFNLLNVLAVLTTLLARGMGLRDAVRRLARLRPVPGRMECFRVPGRPLVVVDYAHTPAALEAVLRSLRTICRGRLGVVFGCGGERDRGKRPQMGAVAARLADWVILTDDNPRGEPGDRIIAGIRAGMSSAPLVVREREEAIARAVAMAGEGDIVLVAGKGHETWQEVDGERRPFSDRAWVSQVLREVPACV